MNRRTFLVSSLGATVLSGCITTGGNNGSKPSQNKDWTKSSRITINSKEVLPTQNGTIVIKAKNIRKMVVHPTQDNPIPLKYEKATFSPHPNSVAESYPPQWYWESTQTKVRAKIPFHVSTDTIPGNYSYTVSISNEFSHHPDSETEKFSITVGPNLPSI